MPQNRQTRRQSTSEVPEPLWRSARAAEYLDITERKLRYLVSTRQVPYLKVGREVRFRRVELDSWLESLRPFQPDEVVAR